MMSKSIDRQEIAASAAILDCSGRGRHGAAARWWPLARRPSLIADLPGGAIWVVPDKRDRR